MLYNIFGAAIAFLCAAIAVGMDAQTELKARFAGAHGTFLLSKWYGYLFISIWGIVDVIFYLTFLSRPEWARSAFNIDVAHDQLWTGFIVGFSAILIFRTNLATVGTIQVGGELAYTFSRAVLIDHVNRARARHRNEFLSKHKAAVRDTLKYPIFFTEFKNYLLDLAEGKTNKSVIVDEIDNTEKGGADPDKDPARRFTLLGIGYDYFGHKESTVWIIDHQYGNI